MINSKTLGIMAIFAASVLVTGALIAAPSYASGDNHKYKGKDKDGVSGDGNTIVKEKNKGKAIASGFGTYAFNVQKNCLTVYSYPCEEFGLK